ncbi:MAG: SMP-30/gluconolactonase/LRE family protein [Steroidobacteraceae bacterium]
MSVTSAAAPTPQSIAAVGATLGEGPAWDGARNCVWFVDIKQHRLYQYMPANGALQSWKAPDQIGWALPAADGSLITGIKGGLYRFDPTSQTFTLLTPVEAGLPGNRLNDATCDFDGAIWFGSMDDSEQHDSGHIYRYAHGAITNSGLPPVCITNGPALSPDGKTLYHVDTKGRRMYASTLDANHVPRSTRLFAAIEDGAGYPDGPTVDSEGCVWTGMFAGWSVRRYDPNGKLLAVVRLPVANVTKVAFGGADLKTAYVTTARMGLSAAELAAQPEAGNLFSFSVNVPGLAIAPVADAT